MIEVLNSQLREAGRRLEEAEAKADRVLREATAAVGGSDTMGAGPGSAPFAAGSDELQEWARARAECKRADNPGWGDWFWARHAWLRDNAWREHVAKLQSANNSATFDLRVAEGMQVVLTQRLGGYQSAEEQARTELAQLREALGRADAQQKLSGEQLEQQAAELTALREALAEARQERQSWVKGAARRQAEEQAVQLREERDAAMRQAAEYRALHEALVQRSADLLAQRGRERDSARAEAAQHKAAVQALMRFVQTAELLPTPPPSAERGRNTQGRQGAAAMEVDPPCSAAGEGVGSSGDSGAITEDDLIEAQSSEQVRRRVAERLAEEYGQSVEWVEMWCAALGPGVRQYFEAERLEGVAATGTGVPADVGGQDLGSSQLAPAGEPAKQRGRVGFGQGTLRRQQVAKMAQREASAAAP